VTGLPKIFVRCFYPTIVSVLVVLATATSPLAQTFTVSGVVVDKSTGEPLPYATIRIENATLGTVSNLSGAFDFHVPTSYLKARLQISMLGYEPFSMPLVEIRGQTLQLFQLKPSIRLLSEVVIADSLSGEEIFKLALAKIEDNYPMTPVLMEGFYRDVKKVGDHYASLLEAAIIIYDKSYKAPRDYTKLRERVGIIEIRKSYDYNEALTKYFEQYNLLEDLLLENSVKYRAFNDEPEFYAHLKRETVIGYNNEPMYLISLVSEGYDLKLYIDRESFALYRLEFGYGDGTTPIMTYKKSRKLENHVMRLDKVVEFAPYKGKFYLKYIRANYKNHWIDAETQEFEITTELTQELMINAIETENPKWIPSSQKMKRYGLQFQNEPYNKEFWDNYNVIKESPIDALIIKDLERDASLELQFKDN
jgi:hypothetical protein